MKFYCFMFYNIIINPNTHYMKEISYILQILIYYMRPYPVGLSPSASLVPSVLMLGWWKVFHHDVYCPVQHLYLPYCYMQECKGQDWLLTTSNHIRLLNLPSSITPLMDCIIKELLGKSSDNFITKMNTSFVFKQGSTLSLLGCHSLC